jgi:tetratricopeptide (TPR) repeat protein
MNNYRDSINPIFYIWSIAKLAYWYIVYILVGLTEDHFQIVKANIFLDLGWYERAIKNYEKALKETKDQRIYAMLGYCYTQTRNFDSAVENFCKITTRNIYPEDYYGYAVAEFHRGNIEKSRELLQEYRSSILTMTQEQQDMIDSLASQISDAKMNEDKNNKNA